MKKTTGIFSYSFLVDNIVFSCKASKANTKDNKPAFIQIRKAIIKKKQYREFNYWIVSKFNNHVLRNVL